MAYESQTKPQTIQVFQDSEGDASWATFSISEEWGDLSGDLHHRSDNGSDCNETSLDDTLPVEAHDIIGVHDNVGLAGFIKQSDALCSQPLKHKLCLAGLSPALPKEMTEFQPVHCSSAIQLDSAGSSQDSESSFDFNPQFCSSKLEKQENSQLSAALNLKKGRLNQKDQQLILCFKQPAPMICENLRSNSFWNSPYGAMMGSEDFKPERCSTAMSESERKFKHRLTGLQDNSQSFTPLRCSTGLIRSVSNPLTPSVPADFKPHRCSTGLQDQSVVFLPLRCSTGLNESATFNPPLSSTAHKVEDSNISEFKNLRMHSEKSSLK